MNMRHVSLCLLAAASVAACAGDGGERVTNNSPLVAHVQQDPVIPDNGTAPPTFADREPLPSCGSYAWSPNDEGPPEGLWTCLAESRERGRPAELIVQAPGTEDHVTVSYYRLPADGDVIEVWTRDVPGGWSRSECDVFDAKSGPGSCEAVGTA